MEFETYEEQELWTQVLLAAIRVGDVNPAVYADTAVVAFRKRNRILEGK